MSSQQKVGLRPTIRKLLLWLNITVAIALLLVYIAPYFDPLTAWMFTLLGMGYPYLLLFNLIFIGVWLVFWKKYAWLSLIVVVLGIVQLDQFYGLVGSGLDVEADDITVLSFNTQGFAGVDMESNSFKKVLQEIQSSDIVLLQEASSSVVTRLVTRLPNHESYKAPGVSLAVLSKFTIGESGLINKENASNGSIWVDVTIDERSIRIYNAHLQSYRVTATAADIIDSGELADGKTWSDIKSVIGRIRDMSKRRSIQVDQISQHIQATQKDIIVGGDFNDTPVSNTYRKLAGKLTDTFCAAGKGVGTTYAGKIPLLRIDYIFADSDFEVVSHDVIDSPISDHYPIKSVIRLQPD